MGECDLVTNLSGSVCLFELTPFFSLSRAVLYCNWVLDMFPSKEQQLRGGTGQKGRDPFGDSQHNRRL